MKLVSIYIENFGGLCKYELNFATDLTTINQPNGFGKTTLAEFIRAMFYGFPRKAKVLEKSRRQKYAPWNGGSFGGNLVFEHEGQRYRIERTFGTTPKADTYALIDLTTNRKSNRFSEEIGIQLFGLDSDSFERSVYVPQIRSDGPLSTAAIQAKLSDLVADSNDIGNYDRAMGQLRAQRSALIPYRGSGGAVAEASSKIAQLQLQLDQALEQLQQLHDAEAALAQTNNRLELCNAKLNQISSELAQSSEMAAAVAQQGHYAQLQQRYGRARQQAAAYDARFREHQPDLRQCREKCEAYETLQKKIRNLEQYSSQLLQEDRKSRDAATGNSRAGMLAWGILSLVLGIGALTGSAVLLLSGQVPIGITALAGGIFLLAVGILALAMRSKKRRIQAQSQQQRRSAMDSRIAAAGQELQLLRMQADAIADEISSFFAGYSINVPPQHYLAGLTQLEHDFRSWQQAQCTVQELAEQLAAMEQTWGEILFAELSAFADPRLLRQQERQLRDDVLQLSHDQQRQLQQIRHLRVQAAQIPQFQEELTAWQEKMKKMREDARILDDTMDYLEQAREKLSTNYLHTIESRFCYYLTQLEGSDGERFLIDGDLNVQIERLGKVRELAYFSAGQADLVKLCMHLALVDALFQEQEVFVILDDPFINLDDAHLAQALRLLQNLKKERQILYLTCHSSRTI